MNSPKIGGIELKVFALAITCMAICVPTGRTQDEALSKPLLEAQREHLAHIQKIRACAKACSDCQRECDDCATWCGNRLLHAEPSAAQSILMVQRNCQDCATCCVAAAQIISRGSDGGPYSGPIAKCCLTVCDRCARVCDSFPDYNLMNEQMKMALSKALNERFKQCAEECRKCETALKVLEKRT